MTDNLPARVIAEPAREVARTDTDSWTAVFQDVVELARGIADTEFVPRGLRGSIPATTAAILYGREVGLPPMTSLNQTHIIEGKPSMAAEAMRAMVLAAGHEIEVLESTGSLCRMRAKRRGTERWTPEVVWSIDMARAAGLLSKNNWKNHPRRMLQARASSELCELYFPDVVLGFRSVEEMQDAVDQDGADEPAEASTTKVTRKRAAKKTTAARPAAPDVPASRPVMDGPPLPGEPGFDGPVQASKEDQSAGGDGDQTTVGEDVPPADTHDDEDVHDVEIVEPEEPAASVDEDPKPGPSTRAQHRMLFGRLEALDVRGDEDRLRIASVLIGRVIESFNSMSKAEASALIETLGFIDDRAALDQLVRGVEERTS